jgi:plastocyanin
MATSPRTTTTGAPARRSCPTPDADPRRPDQLCIAGFIYAHGDLTRSGKAARPPTIKQGTSLTFRNLDSPKGQDPALAIYHTITGCKAPCNKKTGIAYPLANGKETSDSGELGYGPKGATAAENRLEWSTPKNLSAGDYTYFCRVHPSMRGAFRVVAQ